MPKYDPVKYYKGQPLPPWMYENRCIDCIQNLPWDADGAVGFVYVIWNMDRDKRYIGKKLFKTPTGQHTNWLSYVGSNAALKQHIEQGERIGRYIKSFAKTRSRLSYDELALQIEREALLRDDFYNSYIGGKIYGANL